MRPDPVVSRETLSQANSLAERLARGLPLDGVPDPTILKALTGFEFSLTLLNPYSPREGEILAEPLAALCQARQRLRTEALLRGILLEDEGKSG